MQADLFGHFVSFSNFAHQIARHKQQQNRHSLLTAEQIETHEKRSLWRGGEPLNTVLADPRNCGLG
jgi:hypothetical protein